MADAKSDKKIVTTNRKVHYDYSIEQTLEAGLVLTGSEIKSIRANHVNLKDGYVVEKNGEMWLMNVHISPYDQASIFGHDPTRPRKLLLHHKEIAKLVTRMRERGYTVVPTMLYLKKGRAKVEIALAKGKKQYDKRVDLAEKEGQREIARALRERDRE
ncbi:MAG TPA: SsrA-binding protein SmpB [Aggregatilineales bacterium]|nr:SsrA-binding protein SmpB [Aggregatilineales bacterium]